MRTEAGSCGPAEGHEPKAAVPPSDSGGPGSSRPAPVISGVTGPGSAGDRFGEYLADPVRLIAEQFHLEGDRPFGEAMEPWQRDFFEAVFAVRPGGEPVHRLVYEERRRGEAKTSDSAAAALADLLTGPSRHRSYAIAGDQDQASLILDSVADFKARSAVLADLEVQRNTVRNTATGSELRVMSSERRPPTACGRGGSISTNSRYSRTSASGPRCGRRSARARARSWSP